MTTPISRGDIARNGKDARLQEMDRLKRRVTQLEGTVAQLVARLKSAGIP